jgi:DNA repair protein RadD
MQLRYYQLPMVDQVRLHYSQGKRRVCLVMPTGSGKTATAAYIIQQAASKGKRVLFLAHRRELIKQAYATLRRFDILPGVIASKITPTPQSPIQVASAQTLIKRIQKHPEQYPSFDLIVVDECHRLACNTHQSIISHYPSAFVLGLTATPVRLDGKGLAEHFDELVQGIQILDLVEAEPPSLVPPRYFSVPSNIDLSDVKTTAGDWNKHDLIQAVQRSQINGDLVDHWKRHANGLQTIVFAVSVDESKKITQAYLDAGINAAHLDGDTPDEVRTAAVEAYSRGEILVLCNVDLFVEGFDVPNISCVQLARPTKSTTIYYQAIGRALRPAPGKFEAIILDHVGALEQHGNVLTPRVWELETTRKKRPKGESEENPDSKPKERVVNFDGSVQLVEVGSMSDIEWIRFIRILITNMTERGYKKGWAYHKFLKEYPSPSLEQLKVLGKSLNYHHKWADRQYEVLSRPAEPIDQSNFIEVKTQPSEQSEWMEVLKLVQPYSTRIALQQLTNLQSVDADAWVAVITPKSVNRAETIRMIYSKIPALEAAFEKKFNHPFQVNLEVAA